MSAANFNAPAAATGGECRVIAAGKIQTTGEETVVSVPGMLYTDTVILTETLAMGEFPYVASTDDDAFVLGKANSAGNSYIYFAVFRSFIDS